MQSVRKISCEGRSPSSIQREAQEATLHGRSVSLNFVVSRDTLRSLEGVIAEQKSFGSSVIALNLSDSKLNVDNLVAVSALFAKSPLQTLVLERCGIDDRAAPVLAEFMSQCPKLCTVNVRNNALSDGGARLLHKTALNHPCLQSVICDGCPVSVRRQKQLSDIPQKPLAGAGAHPFTPPAPTPHPTPYNMRLHALDHAFNDRHSGAAVGNVSAQSPLSSIAESTRRQWSILTQKQPSPANAKQSRRSSSVPRSHAAVSSAVDRKLSFNSSRAVTQQAVDAVFSPTPRNVDNRIFARNKHKTAGTSQANFFSSSGGGGPTGRGSTGKCDDFGDLLKDQQVALLQSQCHALESELAEQQQMLQVQQERCCAAESQCVQLQQSRQQQTELISILRKDLYRALSTVQAVTARCTQLIGDRNACRDQKRSLEHLIGSFVSGVTTVAHGPQQQSYASESLATSQPSTAKEESELEDGNQELMELLRSIWGNADGGSVAHGEQPTPAIAKVARDFQMAASLGTPGGNLLKRDLLPQFSSQHKTLFPNDDTQQVEREENAAPADADFDDINRFLYSRVSSLMKDHDGGSKSHDASQAPVASAATNRAASEVVADLQAQTNGGPSHSLPPRQTDAHDVQTGPAPEATAKCLVANGNSGNHERQLPSYEELQIQLHTNAASATSAAAATGQTPSSEQAATLQNESRKVQAASAAASLIDPAHGSETLDSMGVSPLSAVQLRSSPHSSSDSLHSLMPADTRLPQSNAADSSVSQVDALANSLTTSTLASPTISSPKTYFDLQIALQHGYAGSASAPIELTNEDAQKSSNSSETTESAQTQSRLTQRRSAFSETSVSRDVLKKSKSQSQVTSSKSNQVGSGHMISTNQNPDKGTAGSSSKERASSGPVGTFNLPSSFFT
jgi:hypothetical protein